MYKGLGKRVSYLPSNILEPWSVAKEGFDLVILSNIIHAYSEEEIPLILDRAANCLKSETSPSATTTTSKSSSGLLGGGPADGTPPN